MSKFKVGDRVICTRNSASYGDTLAYRKGETYVVKSSSRGHISTELDSVGSTINGWGDENFELVPVASATAALVVEAGKYYRTRDGRKVGPMRDYNGIDGYPWDGCGTGQFYNKVGKADDGSEYDLIAEWVDEPVAAQQEAEQLTGQTLTSADGNTIMDVTNGVLTMKVATLGTVTAPTVVKGQLVKTPRGYGYELARFGQWSWVDTGNSQPVIITTTKLSAVAA